MVRLLPHSRKPFTTRHVPLFMIIPHHSSLKCVEVTVDGLEEATNVVSHLEAKISDYRQLPDDRDGLKSAHLGLVDLQNSLQKKQVRRRMEASMLLCEIWSKTLSGLLCRLPLSVYFFILGSPLSFYFILWRLKLNGK